MSTVAKQLRSSYGFESPYFIVDSSGNLVTQTVTVTGNRIELTQGSYLSYNGAPLLTQTALGASITTIPGTLTGLSVQGTVSLNGAFKLTSGTTASVWNPATVSTIDNTVIGSITPLSATFTNLTVNGSITLNSTNISISPPGSLTLGSTGQTINLQGNIALTGTQSFRVAPSDGSLVSFQPNATGSIDNMTIGAITPSTGTFTVLRQTTPDEKWNSSVKNQASTKRYSENIAVALSYFAMGQ